MRTFQIIVLLITFLLAEVSFAKKNLHRPPFMETLQTQFQDPRESRYFGGSNELLELGQLESRGLKRHVQKYTEKKTKIHITPTSSDYTIHPREIEVVQCVPGENSMCDSEHYYENPKKPITILGNADPPRDDWIELITFQVPDGCGCGQKKE